MAAAMIELIASLRSREVILTPQETKILQACEVKAGRDYAVGFLVSSWGFAALLKATTQLSTFSKFCLAGGSASVVGFWNIERSLDKWIDPILDMDGSRMQRELATIIVNKYRNNPVIMQRLYKRFYSENVYDDTTSDKPVLRWRYRSYYRDNGAHSEGTHDNESQSNTNAHVSSHSSSDGKKAQIRSNKVHMNPGANALEDPLDSIFGFNAPVEEIDRPVGSTPTRAYNHSQRRSNRRRRRMHRESLGTKHAQVQQI